MQIAIVGRTDGALRGDCAVYLDEGAAKDG